MDYKAKIKDLDESSLRNVLAGKCRLVGDVWFPALGHLRERKAYHKAYQARQARNARRRQRYGDRRADEIRRLERMTDRERRVLAGSFVSVAVERRSRFVATHSPWDTGIHPAALPQYLIILDMIQLLDRLVVALWRHIRQKTRGDGDPGVKRETQKLARQLDREGWHRPRRRPGANAPIDTLHRLACERRKLLCRATVATQPTATDLRVAWHFRKRSPEDLLRLGGLMMDLECFVDNSLYGKLRGKAPQIKGRHPGIRGWLRENCPELLPKYFTLMRLKGLARRVRQAVEVADPVPTAALLDASATARDLLARELHIQPRGTREPCMRFPWETGERKADHGGRPFLTNKGYVRLSDWIQSEEALVRRLAEARATLQKILAAARHPAASPRHHADAAVHLFREVARCVAERENWWRGPLREL